VVPARRGRGRRPRLSDAELVCLAVAQVLLGFHVEYRWIRFATHPHSRRLHVGPDPDSKDALVGYHPLPVATSVQHAVVASRPTEVCPPGLIDRQFTADAPGRRLVGDI
jgi:hypothetical protein